MGQTLNLKSGVKVLVAIRIMNKQTNRLLVPVLHKSTVRYAGDQSGEIYFEIINQTQFDLTIDILNNNKDKINKIDPLKPFENLIIERNEVLGCSMILEEYITDKGKHLMFNEEKSHCFGEIKIGFDSVFGVSTAREVDYCWVPCTNGGFQTRTEVDGGGGISRALHTPGRALEQVRNKETTTSEEFYTFIKYDFRCFDPK